MFPWVNPPKKLADNHVKLPLPAILALGLRVPPNGLSDVGLVVALGLSQKLVILDV